MRPHAKLRQDLVSSKAIIDDTLMYTVKDPITGTYFRLREPEFWLINQLDGENSPEQVARLVQDKFNINIGAANVVQFIDAIEQLFFLENSRSEQKISRASYGHEKEKTLAGRLLFVQLKAFDPSRMLERVTAVYRRFHNRFWFTVEIAVILAGLTVLALNADYFAVNVYRVFSVGSLVTVFLGMFLLIAFHEFAHAVMCRYHGGEVREMGFLLMYFQPCFYCDLSDAWLFEKKAHRLAVTFAGPYCQLVVLSAAVLLWRITVPGTFINELCWIMVMVATFTFLLNFNPLLKLDGYYLLADWVDIPNLRKKAFAYLGNVIRRKILGWPIKPIDATRRHQRIFALYSVAAVAYSSLLLGYVLFVIGRFLTTNYGGPGLILLFAVLLFILRDVVTKLAKGIVQHIVHMKQLLHHPIRLIVHTVLFVGLLILFVAVPFTHRVSGEVTVRPLSVFTLTLNGSGMLETRHHRGGSKPENTASFIRLTDDMSVLDIVPLVKDGDQVLRGDTLAILTSSQVTHDIVSARADLERLENELSLLKAPPKVEEIAEAEAEVRAAQANLERLERDETRSVELATKQLIAADELDAVRSSTEIARAELARKQSALKLLTAPPRPEEEEVLISEIEKQRSRVDFLNEQAAAQVIVAPFDGGIGSRHDDGNILTLACSHVVEILTPVSDFEIPLVAVGQPVRVKVRAYPGVTYEGTVVRIPKVSDNNDASFPVSVLVANTEGQLSKGMTGYAKIEVGEASLAVLAYRKVLSNIRVEFWSWW